MHPQIIAMAAAEHVRDMQVQATRGRRARAARRARRGGIIVTAAPTAELIVFRQDAEQATRLEEASAPATPKAA